MDEVWERAVEAALGGQADPAAAPRTLTLDGAVKCLHGRLPPPGLLEKLQSLEHLSIANVGVSSLENFPRLRSLQRLIMSDNRIAGGLEFLVRAGLNSLRDLDLSNNRIQFLEDLAPLAQLRLVSLDLYECPVTRIKDYRSRVFGMIRSLKYLDKMDADGNERPETDEEEEDDEDEEDEEDDPGSGEVDGEDRAGKPINGAGGSADREGIVDVDEDEESDADEEEIEDGGRSVANGLGRDSHHLANGFQVAASTSGHREDEESDDSEEEEYIEDFDEEEDLGEEINEEEGGDEEVMEVHEIDDSEEEEDGIEEGDDDEDEDEDDEDLEEEDVEDDGEDPGSTGRLTSVDGEIDGHEQGEEDENGEIGEEDEQGVEDDRESEDEDGEDEEEDEYLFQPIDHAENEGGGSDLDAGNEDNSEQEEVDDDDEGQQSHGGVSSHPSPSRSNKRGRDEDELDDDGVPDSRLSKHR
uniref:Acidic leucine-rich nuclear phosphoprotein 32-related protein n=1 Tax=Anthurium amnicola TaxID=1678845 RepID=A0A1D1YIB8_9ARAE